MAENVPVQRARPTVVAFHRDRYRQMVAVFDGFYVAEEFAETNGVVVDIEFVQKFTVRQPDRHTVAGTANINGNAD